MTNIPCDIRPCSGHAKWRQVFVLSNGHKVAGLITCDAHRDAHRSPESVLTDAAWNRVSAFMLKNGKPPADRAKTSVVYRELNEKDAQ